MICCLNPTCHNPLCPDVIKFCPSCGVPLVVLRNRYRPIKSLGSGGFGKTYLAEDIDKLNEQCVIKQFAPQVQGTKALAKATELFQQEAKRLQQLGEHHQIPTLLAYFEEDNCLYLVQQFIDGQNLLIELQQDRTFSEERIQKLLLDLLNILKFVHQHQVVHRDIKPENIIRRRGDSKLVLIDFGVSKQLTVTVINQPGTTIGSFGYAPLEQMEGGEAYPTSDLYSLGATCFHLLSGIHPWDLWKSQAYGWVMDWRQYLKQPVNQELGQILDKLLQEDYHQRYQSAKEVLEDLNTPSSASSVSATQPITATLSSQPQLKVAPKIALQGKSSSANSGLVNQNGELSKTLLVACAFLILAVGGYKYWQSLPRETTVQFSSQPTLIPNSQQNKDDLISEKKASANTSSTPIPETLPQSITPTPKPDIQNLLKQTINFSSSNNPSNLSSDFIWNSGDSSLNKYELLSNRSLQITASGNTDLSESKNSAPNISYPLSGNFEAEIKVKFSSNIGNQRAGIGIRPPDNPLYYVRIYMLENQRIELSQNRYGYGEEISRPDFLKSYENESVYFKVRKKGTSFSAYYSPDGINWNLAGNYSELRIPNNSQVFFYVLSANNSNQVSGEFSDFKLKPL
jgi:serine/threonine protein kinase